MLFLRQIFFQSSKTLFQSFRTCRFSVCTIVFLCGVGSLCFCLVAYNGNQYFGVVGFQFCQVILCFLFVLLQHFVCFSNVRQFCFHFHLHPFCVHFGFGQYFFQTVAFFAKFFLLIGQYFHLLSIFFGGFFLAQFFQLSCQHFAFFYVSIQTF